MNVLINLLPDTRQVKLRDQRRRRYATAIAVGIVVVCVGLLILLGIYVASQTLLINNATSNIEQKQNRVKGMEGLTDALTAQEHLASLPGLYAQRAYFSKFFAAYSEANPTEVTLTSLNIDASNGLIVNGNARSYAAAAKLAKALEAEHVTIGTGADKNNAPYFTNVVLQSASRSNTAINFTINATLASGVISGN